MMKTPSGDVGVFARIRPTANFAQDLIEVHSDGQTLNIYHRRDTPKIQEPKRGPQSSWSFRFKGVLDNTSQEETYERVCRPVVQGALDGYNGTVMCFGQTGAGKTYTMTGSIKSYQQRGFIPRAIQEVYQEMKKRTDFAFLVRVSFMEIYNETLFDLLPQTKDLSPAGIVVMEEQGRVFVKGLSLLPAQTEEDAFDLWFEGKMNSMTGASTLNRNSSRSHCIFSLHIESRSQTLSDPKYVTSKLSLVDLAGSERVGKAGTESRMFREATYINKSLSFLEQAILALADRRRDHIPFRQSKLTYVLKDSLGGNCNMVLVANIYGEAGYIDETISTLRFASRMKNVQTEPAINENIDPALQIKKLEKEVQDLKEELSIHSTLAMRPGIQYDTLSEAELADITSQVQSYLDGCLQEINVLSIKQIHGVFAELKLAVQKQERKAQICVSCSSMKKDQGPSDVKETDVRRVSEDGMTNASRTPRASRATSRGRKSRDKHGMQADSPSSRKRCESSAKTEPERMDRSVQTSERELESQEPDADNQDTHKSKPPEVLAAESAHKSEAFETFKETQGSQIYSIMKNNKAVLQQRLSLLQQLTEKVSSIKTEIEVVMVTIQQRRGSPDDAEESEEALLLQLSELRTVYQHRLKALVDIREEVKYCEHLVNQCRVRLASEFDTWYEKTYLLPKYELDLSLRNLELTDDQEQQPSAQSFFEARQRMQKKRVTRSAGFSDSRLFPTQSATRGNFM